MTKKIRVGMIGYKFMGKAHSHAYRDLQMFFPDTLRPVMQVICGRNEAGVEQAADQFGWNEFVTDWRDLVNRDDIDIIDINAPSNAHHEIAIAAAEAGKHLFCEKPLAITLAGAREMLQAAQKAAEQGLTTWSISLSHSLNLAIAFVVGAGEREGHF